MAFPMRYFGLVLGPLLFLTGALTSLAVDQELLPYRDLFRPGLLLAAAGAVVWGVQGLRSRRLRLLHLALLLAGLGFFALDLYYLIGDYRYLEESAHFRALLVVHQNEVVKRIGCTAAALLASCLLGLLLPAARGSRSARPETRPTRRRRTASFKPSRTVRRLKR